MPGAGFEPTIPVTIWPLGPLFIAVTRLTITVVVVVVVVVVVIIIIIIIIRGWASLQKTAILGTSHTIRKVLQAET
jgi:NADH:ubiquinone oxidoreductase subunit H